ncbi:hypothetical protein M0P65_05390 [Candidatus Gracilibacteria bacterium]|nr:hypothetical protein [Candidatus Gracilibacteria bacterium]
MIGYKATYNGRCIDQFYEVGETYTLEGKLIMCENGFHFCQDLYDVFTYYSPQKDIKVFKVEALGETINHPDKSVTNKIKILEEVNLSNLILEKRGFKKHFDNKGNFIKYEDSKDFWVKYEYDENNNLIKYENSKGFWIKNEYNSNNNIIRAEDCTGYWIKYEYDKNNNLIKVERLNGYWEKYEYDDYKNRIKHEDSNGHLN